MRKLRYKSFSWRTHKKNRKLKRPNVCQFELTFRCGLHCKHCYTDCYNNPAHIKKELKTEEVKFILDKAHNAGVIWICFTGGDPLTRADFLDIYSYAKDKSFIITIFTNVYSMTKEIANYLKKSPPFVIEMTLDAVKKETHERISQVRGSFDKVMDGLGLILRAKLPLKIKTQVSKENLNEIPMIKKFIEGLSLRFRPNYELYARLNGDLASCNLRISPSQLLSLNGDEKRLIDDCQISLNTKNESVSQKPNTNLFRCAIGGGDGINIDPYGNMFICHLMRKPAFNLLKVDIEYALDRLLPLVRGAKFTTDSKCNGCNLRELCLWCPGKALIETKDKEMPSEYYCKLAHLIAHK